MSLTCFCHVFETPLGWLGVGWSDLGVSRVLLPAGDGDATLRRLRRLCGDHVAVVDTKELPQPVAAAVDMLRRYAAGEQVDFSEVVVDLRGAEPFQLAIYDAARKLRYGEAVTYGQLSVAAGHPGEARETGAALGKNPVPIIVPCHRIVAAGGKIGGFSAPGGSSTKQKLLAMEGASLNAPSPQAAFHF